VADLNDLLRRVVFKHRRQRDVQGFADAIKTRCTDPVDAAFIFLNLLERNAQFSAKLLLAHIKR
jgi:hypothetical protein